MPNPVKVVSIFYEHYTMQKDEYYVDEACNHPNSMICSIPSQDFVKNVTVWNKSCCVGLDVDLLKLLEEKLHFNSSLYIVEDNKYGGFYQGKAVGLIGDVYYGKATMAIPQLTITSNRREIVDFTQPYIFTQLAIIKRKPTPYESNRIFDFQALTQSSYESALAMLGLVLFSIIMIYYSELFIYKNKNSCTRSSAKKYSIAQSMLYVIGNFTQHDLAGKPPFCVGNLVIAYTLTFALFLCSTMYTAAVTTNLLVIKSDFTGIKDPKIQQPTDAFKFGVWVDTSTEQYFRFNFNPKMKRIYQFMKKYSVTTATPLTDILRKISIRELDGWIDHDYQTLLLTELSGFCELEAHPFKNVEAPIGLALARDSRLTDVLSNALLEMREDGKIEELKKKWLSRKKDCHQTYQRFSKDLFSTQFILLSIGIVFSIFILIVECVRDKVKPDK